LVDLSVGKPAKKVIKMLLFHAPHDSIEATSQRNIP